MTPLREIIPALTDAKVEYVLRGGVACVLQGVERVAMYVDIALKILRQSSPEDFDGHTAFARMTPVQRLTWLDEANAAYLELHGCAVPELRVAEGATGYKVRGK